MNLSRQARDCPAVTIRTAIKVPTAIRSAAATRLPALGRLMPPACASHWGPSEERADEFAFVLWRAGRKSVAW